MDGTQFDTLIKRLGTRPLTRSTALRALAASVAALAGVTLAAEPGAAKDKRKVCHCTDETAASCKTIKVGKKAARKHVNKHACDYRGTCQGISGCCFANAAVCTTEAQCCSGFCGDGTCRLADCADVGQSCATLSCCSGNCQGLICQPCKSVGTACVLDSECCSLDCNVTCQPPAP